MVSFFREKSSAGVFWLLLLALALHFQLFTAEAPLSIEPAQGLLGGLMQGLDILPSQALTVLYFLFLLLPALLLNTVMNNLRMFQKQAMTTALAWVLFASLLPEWGRLSPALVCGLLLIWLVEKMSRLIATQEPKTLIYNIGVLTGAIVLLYFPATGLILLCFAGLGILRPFRPDEWFVLLLGILTPAYFLGAWLYLTGRIGSWTSYLPTAPQPAFKPSDPLALYLGGAVMLLMLVSGIFVWRRNRGKILIQLRKAWAVIIFMLIFLSVSCALTIRQDLNGLLLLTLPVAALSSNAFLYPRRPWWPASLFWLAVAASLYNAWHQLLQ